MRDKKTFFKLTSSAVLSVLAAVCGILEGMLPLQFVIPVPGVKLGIANIFVVFAFYFLGYKYAFAVTLSRILIVFLFSGNGVAFVMSFIGAVLSFAALCFMMRFYNKAFTFIGVSAFTAVFHGLGQLTAAYIIIGISVVYYLPIMLAFCALTGVFTGTLMNISVKKVSVLFSKVK